MQRINFMLPFWGKAYREYFVDRCLPSLLAPHNFPLLRAEDGHRLLVATTQEDFAAIEHLPIMKVLRRHVTPVLLPIQPPGATPPGSVAAIMQQNHCQRLLVETAYRDRTYACMLWPDIIFSDGLVTCLQRWIAQGQQLVLFASLRHGEEAVLDELDQRGLLPKGPRPSETCKPFILSPRALADLSVRRLHPEVAVYDMDDPRIPILPAFMFKRIAGEGIILHTFDGQPILMDFGAIEDHDTDCLSRELFEYAYVDRNFGHCDKIHIVDDSDAFGVLSLTPQGVGALPLQERRRRTPAFQRLGLAARMRAAMIFHTKHGAKGIRKRLFSIPIRWHGTDVSSAWTDAEGRIDSIIASTVGDYYQKDRTILSVLAGMLAHPSRILGELFYRVYVKQPYAAVAIDAIMGSTTAWNRIGRAIQRRIFRRAAA
jgi:hypothetical protein